MRILFKVAHDTIVSQNNRQLNDYDRLHVAEKIAIFDKIFFQWLGSVNIKKGPTQTLT